MTAKIFRSTFLVTLAIQLASLLIFGITVKELSDRRIETELSKEASYIAEGIELAGKEFLLQLDRTDTRIMQVASDGRVLFDTGTEMDQSGKPPAGRPEIANAFRDGLGFDIRNADSVGGRESTAFYALRLSDGTVICVAAATCTVTSLLLNAWLPILIAVFATLLVAGLFASFLSHHILHPLTCIDFAHPEQSRVDPEFRPMINRLIKQNRDMARQMEEIKLRQNEFDAITANMNEGMVVLNANAEILSCNRCAETVLAHDAPLPRSVLSLPDSECFREAVRLALSGQNGLAFLRRDDAYYSILAAPVQRDGEIEGAILVILDETEKESRERLRREFTANISHELKTPLTSISGFAELIKNNMTDPESTKRFSERIYREAQRLIALVGDIIRLSQLDGGEISFDSNPVDLLGVAEEIRDRLENVASTQKITLSVKGPSLTVRGNRKILFEMLYNLMDNAIKYNRPGNMAEITLSSIDGKPAVTVRDNGIGIPKDQQPRIFERFFRVDKSHSKEIGGTGLGLSIVKHGAAFHHAKIILDSTPGVGTAITLLFEAPDADSGV